ncbi:fibroblast growth factor 1-like [Stylophora pistillata]|uniref:Fibroblast growth factor 1 n=1 Tax=Stylophora pistillata TaxID=50429 RepID=A0A2B4RPX2_STYPI|nr:fibroblast growth factor 1-like [Stylophora pistillata]PFX18387.1 Fibroblast growth factor 1 [Stylophora pistillata]
MARKLLRALVLSVLCLFPCFAKPTRKTSSTTNALENSGINPGDVVNNVHNVVRILMYKRLYSRNSAKFVRIHHDEVDGSGNKHDPSVTMRLESVGPESKVILKSHDGSVCVCLDSSGAVVTRPSHQVKTDIGCIFQQEHTSKGYTRYRSTLNRDWYLAITRDGRTKSAKKAHQGQRSVQFIEYTV